MNKEDIRDRFRIRWLEENMPQLAAIGIGPSGTWQFFDNEGDIVKPQTSFRDLIDAAMLLDAQAND